jgi:hypothetical protein
VSFFRRPQRGSFAIRLLSRPGCHLCDELRAEAEPAIREAGGTLDVVDVDSDRALAERWGNEIPVLLDAEGRLMARAKDGAAKIRRRLGI